MTDTLATSGEPPRRPRLPDELAARYGEGAPEPPAEDNLRRAANDEPASERGISPVGRRFAAGTQGKVLGMVGMVAAAGLLIVATWDRGDAKPDDSPLEKTPARQVVNYEGPDADSPLLSKAAHDPNAPVLNPDGTLTAGGDGGGVPPMQPTQAAAGPSAADQRRQLAEAARRAPIIAYSANRGLAGFSGPAAAAGEGAREANELDKLRRTAGVAQARAEMLPDRNFLITAGSSIPCVLQTALDSSVPGYATCLVPRDVYSDNGRVVLMEKGTKVLGEYRGGIRQGQKRLFVLWTRAVTPNGVAVSLASPAADGLGRAGFDGKVDTFFWERFGGALLLSIIDDAANIAAQSAGRGRFNTTMDVPSETASIALQNSIGIPPRLRKNQGEEVSIFVAQDLNFADVYGLALR